MIFSFMIYYYVEFAVYNKAKDCDCAKYRFLYGYRSE